MSSGYFKCLSEENKRRYIEKLTYHGSVYLPDPYDAKNAPLFSSDLVSLPKVTWPYLFDYLVETPGPFTRERLKAHKSLEAFNYFVNGKVASVCVHQPTSLLQLRLVAATVQAGQREARSYDSWIVAEEGGEVLAGHCTYMAGLGEVCSHVAALLLFIEAAVRNGVTDVSSTSVRCAWSASSSSGKAAPSSVVEIDFSQPKHGGLPMEPASRKTFVPPRPKGSPLELFSYIKEHSPSAKLLRMVPSRQLDPEATDSASEDGDDPELLPLPLTSVSQEDYRNLPKNELEDILISVYDCLMISKAEADFLERSTRKQSRSEAWHLHRRGRITASNFSRVKTLQESSSPTLLITNIMGYSTDTNMGGQMPPQILWGIEKEPVARQSFVDIEALKHTDFNVAKSGLVVNPLWPYLGASPDGIVSCACCPQAVLEIKCSYKYRHVHLSTVNDKDFYLDEDMTLQEDHAHYFQIQGQMALTGLQMGYFVVWTECSLVTITIQRDEQLWEELLTKLESFFLRHILPELVTRRLDPDVGRSAVALYCTCKKPQKGRMIACDSDTCTTIWYHYRCVNLKRKPSKKWYCSSCK
ncbi:unnamed protein product [Ixodes hexagonus]